MRRDVWSMSNKIITPEEYEINLMEKDMINKELHVEDVIEIYNEKILVLKKEIDRLNLELECKQIELMQERAKNND
jgi:uncharacterized small protein (DUF1192 family)